jgi:mannose-1-phosphate guanylyltransferase
VTRGSKRRGGVYPLILAGGSGTRFWPLSRRSRPKQVLALGSKDPLIVETVRRLRGFASSREIAVACGRLHANQIRSLLPEIPREQFLIEPVARNTAPIVGWAALRVRAKDPDGVMVVLPSDHRVENAARFRALLKTAARLCQDGTLFTLGIVPIGPETGYGYLRLGAKLPGGARGVKSFVEKPSLAEARRYLATREYLWNAGIFIFRADAILREIERLLPQLAKVLDRIAPTVGTRGEQRAVEELFPRAPSISLDYGVMERAPRVATLPADMGWSDLGSFTALFELARKDSANNVTEGQALLIDSHGCLALGRERPMVLLGVDDLVVVDAGDVLLVVPKARAQEVRLAVEELSRRGLTHLL